MNSRRQSFNRIFVQIAARMPVKSLTIILPLILLLLSGQIHVSGQTGEPPANGQQSPDSAILLEKITIEGFRLSSHLRLFPGNMAVVSGRELSPADGTSLATTLNTIPGVIMQSGTYATNRIVIRGMGSRTPYNTNRIKAYLNDIPLTASDGISTPEDIDASGLARMEVIRGPASALYGSGLGGSINLFTPDKLRKEGILNAGYGSFNTLRTGFSGTLNTEKSGWWGSLSHLNSDGYRDNNEFNRTTFITTGKWRQPKWTLKSTLFLTRSDGEIPSSLGKTQFENEPRAAAPNWAEIKGYKRIRKALAGVTLFNSLSPTLSSQLTLYGKWSDNYEKRPFNNLGDRTLSAGLRGKLSHTRKLTDWVLGIDWSVEQYKWKLDKDNDLLNENRENRSHLSLFAVVNYRPVQKLNVSLAGNLIGIRYRLTDLFAGDGDRSGSRNFPLIASPRLGINYAAGDRLAFFASAGHGFSMPSPEETLLPEGNVNPDIQPEQGMQYEAGTRMRLFEEALEAEISVYRIDLRNLLVTKRITEDIFTGINAGKTIHHGMELLLRNRIFDFRNFPGKLTSALSYAFSRNRFIDFTDDGNTYDGNKLPGIPEQNAQLQLLWNPAADLAIHARLQYTGSQFLNDANTLNYGSYFLLHLKLMSAFPLKKAGNLNIYAGIQNLTGTHYASMLLVNAPAFGSGEPRYYYPGLPRHFYAGVEFRF